MGKDSFKNWSWNNFTWLGRQDNLSFNPSCMCSCVCISGLSFYLKHLALWKSCIAKRDFPINFLFCMGTELFLLSVSPDEVAKCKLQSSGSCKFFRKVASVFWLSASLFVSLNLLIVSSVVFYSFMKIFLLLGRYFQHFILCFSFQRDMWLDNLVHGNKTLTRNIPLSKIFRCLFCSQHCFRCWRGGPERDNNLWFWYKFICGQQRPKI